MRLVTDWRGIATALKGASVALGNFDGVHRGHQRVIALAAEAARTAGKPLGVISFEPHPRRWFQPDAQRFRLVSRPHLSRGEAPVRGGFFLFASGGDVAYSRRFLFPFFPLLPRFLP